MVEEFEVSSENEFEMDITRRTTKGLCVQEDEEISQYRVEEEEEMIFRKAERFRKDAMC